MNDNGADTLSSPKISKISASASDCISVFVAKDHHTEQLHVTAKRIF